MVQECAGGRQNCVARVSVVREAVQRARSELRNSWFLRKNYRASASGDLRRITWELYLFSLFAFTSSLKQFEHPAFDTKQDFDNTPW